jgi:hypothetical protein
MRVIDKSLTLIRQYDPDYASEGEGPQVITSARRRRKVAQCLGITPGQMNFAVLSVNYM